MEAQSRLGAKLFLQSSELGLPQPLTPRRVCPCPPPPPPVLGGGAHSLAREGWESPNSDEGTYRLWYSLYLSTMCNCAWKYQLAGRECMEYACLFLFHTLNLVSILLLLLLLSLCH
jgi:hypothetical protein